MTSREVVRCPRFFPGIALTLAACLSGCGDPPPQSAEPSLVDRGKALYEVSCAACHQIHGKGMEGVGPPVAGSEWAIGSEQRLIRIVLHGVRGTIDVDGRSYNLEMPAMGIFSDDEIAAILTYIRQAWGNEGEPVTTDSVAAIRQTTKDRRDSWTAEELLEIR